MKQFILAVALALGTTGAFAFGGTDNNNNNNQGQVQAQKATAVGIGVGHGEGGSAHQGQAQRQSSRNTNLNAAGAYSNSSSDGNTQGVFVDASKNEDYPVNTAAAVYNQVCMQGASVQSENLGISVGNSDPLCDTLKVASVFWTQHILEHQHGNHEQAAYWKEKYVEQMKDVETLMEATDEVAIVDRFAGYMLRPLGVIALLVFLL